MCHRVLNTVITYQSEKSRIYFMTGLVFPISVKSWCIKVETMLKLKKMKEKVEKIFSFQPISLCGIEISIYC